MMYEVHKDTWDAVKEAITLLKKWVQETFTGLQKLGTASTKDYTTYVSPTQTKQLPISSSVYSAMTSMLRGAYHPAGSKTVAELTSDLLVKANLGNVYKITEGGVTSELFIGGAGQTIKTGDNAIVLFASEDTYKFSLESGMVDLDSYQKKELSQAIEGANTVEDALNALSNGKVTTDLVPSDASTSNKLVTKDALNDDVFDKQYFYKTSQTFTAGSNVIYNKVCSYSGQFPFIVRLEGQRINTTVSVQEISGTFHVERYKYTLTRICDSVYAASTSRTLREESNYLIVDANNDVWVVVASYSRAKVTVLSSSKVTIDTTSGIPVGPYKVDGYSDKDSKLTSTVTSDSIAPLTAGGAWNNFAQKTRVAAVSSGTVTLSLQNSALYRITVDRHQQDTFIGEYLLGIYGTSSITLLTIKESSANQVTFTHNGNTLTVKSGNTYITVYAEYLGGYN